VAIIAARLEARAGKASEARRALASVVSQAKAIGIPGLEFEAQLAQGEIGLYGGDKRAALSLLSNLRKDASNKGLKLYESRASEMARQISSDNRPRALRE
jgi:hypothetical protein